MIKWINEQLGTASFENVKGNKEIFILDVRDLVDKEGNSKKIIIEKINLGIQHINNNEKVVVCCDYGMSRSNAIAIGILSKIKNIDFNESIKIVEKATNEKAIKLEILSLVNQAININEKMQKNRTKNFLVIGANGFIGKNIVPILKINNNVYYPNHNEVDIFTSPLDLKIFADKNNITHIIHLANPRVYNCNNSIGETTIMLKNVIDICEQNEIHLTYLSSSEVYSGYKTNYLFASEKLALLPKGAYGETKYLCEKLIKNHEKTSNLKATIIRSSLVYGIKSEKPRFIYNFIEKAKSGQIIFTHKYLNDFPRVDLLYIDDICEILCKIVESDILGDFNIGTGNLISTTEIAEFIVKKLESKSSIVQREIDTYCANIAIDTNKTLNLFKWKAKTNVLDGLNYIIDSYSRKG